MNCDYLPFGEGTQPLAGDRMRFAGKELDAESAQECFGARYYRNVFGRSARVPLALIRSPGRFSYATCVSFRSNAAGLIRPTDECRRRSSKTHGRVAGASPRQQLTRHDRGARVGRRPTRARTHGARRGDQS